jgi:hypothetical protein
MSTKRKQQPHAVSKPIPSRVMPRPLLNESKKRPSKSASSGQTICFKDNRIVAHGHPKDHRPVTRLSALSPARSTLHMSGVGKYNMVKPEKVFHSPEHEKEYRKKKEYKKKAEDNGWWDKLIDGGTKAFDMIAPHLIKALAGFGDYDVHSNSLLAASSGGDQGSEIPMMCNTKTANVMRMREFICNVLGSTSSFKPITIPIQPGSSVMFPWLHLTAAGFTSYKMLGAVMEFNSLFGQVSAGGYLGYVAMGTQYNSMEPVFVDKESLVTSEYANSKRSDISFMHPIECSPDQQVLKQQYIRTGPLSNDSDLKFYDLGNFTIATGGQNTDGGIVGELWITYEVAFFQPKLAASGARYINYDHWFSADATPSLLFGTPSGKTRDPARATMLGTFTQAGATTTYIFPKEVRTGLYKLEWLGSFPLSSKSGFPSVTAVVNCFQTANILVDGLDQPSYACPLPTSDSSGLTGMITWYFKIAPTVEGPASITFTPFGDWGTITNFTFDFTACQIPSPIEKMGEIEGTEAFKKLFVQGYQDPVAQSSVIEDRILNLQSKLNVLKSKKDKENQIKEVASHEMSSTLIKHCLELFPEVDPNFVLETIVDSQWDYQTTVAALADYRKQMRKIKESLPKIEDKLTLKKASPYYSGENSHGR